MTKPFTFKLADLSKKLIAAGGGGKIFDIGQGLVLKYFHIPEPMSFESHLNSLQKLPDKFVKPVDIFTTGNKVVGYSMPFVDFNKFHLFNTFFNKNFCTKNNISLAFKTSSPTLIETPFVMTGTPFLSFAGTPVINIPPIFTFLN